MPTSAALDVVATALGLKFFEVSTLIAASDPPVHHGPPWGSSSLRSAFFFQLLGPQCTTGHCPGAQVPQG